MCVSCGYCAHEWCYSHAPYDCPTASNEEALFVTFHYQSGTRKGSGQYAVSMSSSIPNYCSPPAPPTSLINISWEDCPKVKALYDYDGITDVELSFIAGDVLTLIDKPSTNWWWCEFQGFEGYAPPSYLQEIIDDDDK